MYVTGPQVDENCRHIMFSSKSDVFGAIVITSILCTYKYMYLEVFALPL